MFNAGGITSDIKDQNGEYWIAQNQTQNDPPVWCPGSDVPIRAYLYADHNGVHRWEYQQAEPGQESEEGFQSFTDWRSINSDSDTHYYMEDGVTDVLDGKCISGEFEGQPWDWNVPHCREKTWASYSVRIPNDMPTGPMVLRWIWRGAVNKDLKYVDGPEKSLFVNCADVIIGTPEECLHSTAQDDDVHV